MYGDDRSRMKGHVTFRNEMPFTHIGALFIEVKEMGEDLVTNKDLVSAEQYI